MIWFETSLKQNIHLYRIRVSKNKCNQYHISVYNYNLEIVRIKRNVFHKNVGLTPNLPTLGGLDHHQPTIEQK